MRQSKSGLILDILKNRGGGVGSKLRYSWDIDTGHFAYIPGDNDAARQTTIQNVVQSTTQEFSTSNASFNPF